MKRRRRWLCVGDSGIKSANGEDGAPDMVFANSAEEAACEWARDRGHDPDDNPVVTVSAVGEPTRTFVLSARVIWKAREEK